MNQLRNLLQEPNVTCTTMQVDTGGVNRADTIAVMLRHKSFEVERDTSVFSNFVESLRKALPSRSFSPLLHCFGRNEKEA